MKHKHITLFLPLVLICSTTAADSKVKIEHKPYLQNITGTGVTIT